MSRDITTLRELAAEARKYHALDYMAPAISAAADRLAALEESNTLLSASLKNQDAQIERLEQDNARLRGQISAMLGELEDFAMQNDLPIEDGHGYFGTGLPLRALQEWLFRQKDALAGGDA